jgi:hypothetical protein
MTNVESNSSANNSTHLRPLVIFGAGGQCLWTEQFCLRL